MLHWHKLGLKIGLVIVATWLTLGAILLTTTWLSGLNEGEGVSPAPTQRSAPALPTVPSR